MSGKLRLELARFREKESFTAFASELDAETQLQLKRGRILVEILKQNKHVPMPVEEQVISVFLATSNMIDHLEITDVKQFELDLIEHIRKNDPEILSVIRETKKFSPDADKKVRAHIQSLLDKAN
ncbi:hypothetical protein EBR96_04175 [bacterium]|nr:hypothetical protein [bacterium]